jgi:hypothetical protein
VYWRLICQECGGDANPNSNVCNFCGAPLDTEKKSTSKTRKDFNKEPPSKANISDVTGFLSSSIKAAGDLLSGDPLSFVADAGKAVSDYQNIKNDSEKKQKNRTEIYYKL